MDRNDIQALLRLRHELAAMRFEIALLVCSRKYSDGQPRVPAGQPGGGQWAGGDGGETRDNAVFQIAGGISKTDEDLTVQQFVSRNCRGGIYEDLPGEFLGMDIKDVMDKAKKGDAGARTCLKLISRDRFRK